MYFLLTVSVLLVLSSANPRGIGDRYTSPSSSFSSIMINTSEKTTTTTTKRPSTQSQTQARNDSFDSIAVNDTEADRVLNETVIMLIDLTTNVSLPKPSRDLKSAIRYLSNLTLEVDVNETHTESTPVPANETRPQTTAALVDKLGSSSAAIVSQQTNQKSNPVGNGEGVASIQPSVKLVVHEFQWRKMSPYSAPVERKEVPSDSTLVAVKEASNGPVSLHPTGVQLQVSGQNSSVVRVKRDEDDNELNGEWKINSK